MDEKTQNQIMEEIAQMYEEKPWMKINEFYLYGKGVCVHFATFGSADALFMISLEKKYNVSWVVFPHRSVDNDVCVNIYP